MKMSSTIKVAVVATALVAIGKVIYDKVKACNEDTIDSVLISLDQFKEACCSARADIFQLTEQN